eukprot:g20018.t1
MAPHPVDSAADEEKIMRERAFGRTSFSVSEIGFGGWQIGGSWGDVSEEDGRRALNAALDAGVTFIDTADVYGDGRSERIVAEVLDERSGPRPMVATKAGRRLNPHVAEGYTKANLGSYVDRSLKNLRTDSLDLLQLHCPPTEVYYRPEVFAALDELRQAGKIRNYGVSVEKVEEALKAIEFPNVASIQIIYNIFRQRPADLVFQQAKRKDVAVIVRVGLQAVEEVRKLVPAGVSMAAFALKWILMNEAVTVVIPGARNEEQARGNAAAAELAALSADTMRAAEEIYARLIAPHVHQRW